MKKFFITVMSVLAIGLVTSCNEDDGNGDGDSNDNASEILNENFVVTRPNTFIIDPADVEVDNSILVNSGGNGYVPLRPGDNMTNQIFFNSPNSNVVAVGMRFGDTGPITFVELTQEEIDAGVGALPFNIDPSVCENIAEICHDIKCYEFAYTDAGTISQSDLQDIALICGACEEPSCLDLLDEATCNGIAGEDGSPRFNLTWSGSADLDLYVEDPNGNVISYLSPTSPTGGSLDVDCTGDCPGGNSENITWPAGGPTGTYTFWVNYYSGSGSVSYNILVRDNDQNITTQSGSVSQAGDDSPMYTYTKN